MAYCEVTDVQNEFKTIVFTETSLVTQTSVSSFIDQASALIDSYVGQRFVVPIRADASSLALMQLYCIVLVSERIRAILANKQTTNSSADQAVRALGMGVKDVLTALTAIKMGDQQLSGASLLLDNAGFYSNNESNGVNPRFNKSRKQW